MSQFQTVQQRSRVCGAACLMAGAMTACVPESASRGSVRVVSADAASSGDAGNTFAFDDTLQFPVRETNEQRTLDAATPLPEDGPMERPDFIVETSADGLEVHAGGRAVLPLRLVRTGGYRAWIELRVSGLPANVSGFFAMSPEADHAALVIEASDQAALVELMPFTLEANGDGLRRTRRMALTVLPEEEVEE